MTIKADWEKAQEGLYAEKHTFIVNGNIRTRYNIYSADGYCFCCIHDDEDYPIYMEMAFTPCITIEEINQNFKSIPISEQNQPIVEDCEQKAKEV